MDEVIRLQGQFYEQPKLLKGSTRAVAERHGGGQMALTRWIFNLIIHVPFSKLSQSKRYMGCCGDVLVRFMVANIVLEALFSASSRKTKGQV